jgi:hypothetical protein
MKDRVSHPQHVVLTQPFDPAFELPASRCKIDASQMPILSANRSKKAAKTTPDR